MTWGPNCIISTWACQLLMADAPILMWVPIVTVTFHGNFGESGLNGLPVTPGYGDYLQNEMPPAGLCLPYPCSHLRLPTRHSLWLPWQPLLFLSLPLSYGLSRGAPPGLSAVSAWAAFSGRLAGGQAPRAHSLPWAGFASGQIPAGCEESDGLQAARRVGGRGPSAESRLPCTPSCFPCCSLWN